MIYIYKKLLFLLLAACFPAAWCVNLEKSTVCLCHCSFQASVSHLRKLKILHTSLGPCSVSLPPPSLCPSFPGCFTLICCILHASFPSALLQFWAVHWSGWILVWGRCASVSPCSSPSSQNCSSPWALLQISPMKYSQLTGEMCCLYVFRLCDGICARAKTDRFASLHQQKL